MSQDTKKSRPSDCSTRTAAEAGTIGKEPSGSYGHCNTNRGDGQIQIADFLGHGQENAVPLKHLTQLTGLRSRDLRRRIELERRSGALILSDNQHGYYLADTPAEAKNFVRSMRHRAGEILRTALAVESAAERTAEHD